MELSEFTLPILSPLGTILSLIPSDLPMSSDPSGMWRQTESVFERDSPPPHCATTLKKKITLYFGNRKMNAIMNESQRYF